MVLNTLHCHMSSFISVKIPLSVLSVFDLFSHLMIGKKKVFLSFCHVHNIFEP